MTRIILSFLLLILFNLCATAQKRFIKYQPLTNTNIGLYIPGPDSGYYTMSYLNGNILLSRLNKEAHNLWSKSFGGTNIENGGDLIRTADGGFLITGYTESFTAGNDDVYVIKTDSLGNVIWSKSFGGPYDESGLKAYENLDGSFTLLANSESFGNAAMYLLKVDANGILLWSKTYQPFYQVKANAFLKLNENRFLLVGSAYDPIAKSPEIAAIMVDELGNVRWSKFYGESGAELTKSALQVSANELLIYGTTTSYGKGDKDIYLMSIDTLGNQLYFNTYGTEKDDVPNFVYKNNNDQFFIGSSTVNPSNGAWNGVLIKTDPYRNITWARKVSDTASGVGQIFMTPDSMLMFTGHKLKGSTYYSFLAKTNSSGNSSCFFPLTVLDQRRLFLKSRNVIPIITQPTNSANALTQTGSANPVFVDSCISTCSAQAAFHTPINRICAGTTIDFTNQSTGSTSSSWQVENVTATTTNFSHTFTKPGLFQVALTATGACTDRAYTQIRVDSLPEATFTYSRKLMVVQFDSQSTVASGWYWEFGDGEVSHGKNPKHVYPKLGSYQACLSMFTSCDTVKYCRNIIVEDTSGTKFLKVHLPNPANNTQQWPKDLVPTRDGGYAVTGVDLVYTSNKSSLLIKYDAQGNAVWSKAIGPSTSTGSNSIIECADLGYFLGGSTGNPSMIKVDPNGNMEWSKSITLPNVSQGQVYSVDETHDSGFVATGLIAQQLFVIKLNKFGDLEWMNTYATARMGNKILEAANHDLLVTGYTPSNEMYIARLSQTGQIIWSKTINARAGYGIAEGRDGSLLFSGMFYDGGFIQKAILIKLSSTGQMVWNRKFELNSYHAIGYTVSEDESGDLLMTCGSNNTMPIALRTDAAGIVKWAHRYAPEPQTQSNVPGKITYDQGFILAGLSKLGMDNISLIKTDSNGQVGCGMTSVTVIQGPAGLTLTDASGDQAVDPGPTLVTASLSVKDLARTDSVFCFTDVYCRPKAGFSYLQNELDLQFVDSFSNATIREWDFGDGSFSTQQYPSHTYADTGVYLVCLKVYNDCGVDSICLLIHLCYKPEAKFIYALNATSVQFTNQSSHGGTYLWLFGDGAQSAQENPSHTYASTGNYPVCLKVSNSCSMDSTCQTLVILNSGFDNLETMTVFVYPNPMKDASRIEVSGPLVQFPLTLTLYDMYGREIRVHSDIQQSVIEIQRSNLAPGIYQVEVRDRNGAVKMLRLTVE